MRPPSNRTREPVRPKTSVAVGYRKARHDRIEIDPDLRVREGIALVFRKFGECRNVRQVHLWLRQEEIRLPAVEQGPAGPRIIWKLPVCNTVLHLLTNPIYAGAYAFGRTCRRVSTRDGRKRVVRGYRRAQSDWEVLIPDHHEGYISWEEFARNQRLIADNANSKGLIARGSVRRGDALLAGLLRCGHCGRRLHVSYSGTAGYCVRYLCRGAHLNHGTERCIAFGGLRVDAAVSAELLRVLAPLGIEAALHAIDARAADNSKVHRQAELALTQARYEAGLARRQYDAVDPDNRLVASELERRWNDRLVQVHRIEEQLAALVTAKVACRRPRNAPELVGLDARTALARRPPYGPRKRCSRRARLSGPFSRPGLWRTARSVRWMRAPRKVLRSPLLSNLVLDDRREDLGEGNVPAIG